MKRRLTAIGIMTLMALMTGCAGTPVIPPDLKDQIDSSVSFSDLSRSPSTYTGKTLLLGGEILSARRVKEGTQVEVLQLPVQDGDPPALRRTDSQGRFLAFDREGRDPASYPAGTRITVVGEVTGESVQPLDESEYRYPTVEIKHLHVWPEEDYRSRQSPSVGLFGGVGFGFGGGRSGSFGGVGVGTGF